MQPKFSLLFIKPTASNGLKMVRVVVLVLCLMTATFALPITPEGQVTPEVQGTTQTHQQTQSQEVEKTGYQGSPETYTPVEQVSQQNAAVPKVENVPVGVENSQPSYTENSVLLPIQPLSVVPVSSAGQIFRPVVVPAEAIANGRVIIAGLETIQQRSFQDVVGTPEKQVPQIVQPLIYTSVQAQEVEPNKRPYYSQPVEKVQQVQQTEQVQPNEASVVRESVENYNPVTQVYSVQQNVRPEHQVPVQSVEPVVQQNQIQKQVPYQQVPYQGQEVEPQYQQQVYSGKPTTYENVEKQGQQVYDQQQRQGSPYTPVQTQAFEQVYSVQPVQEHVPQVQSVQQQVYNVQPVQDQVPQVYNVQQQEYNVQPVPSEKQGYQQVQAQVVEPQQQQTQSVRQAVEQVSQQQPVQTGETVPVQPVYQQVYNVAVDGAINPIPYQQQVSELQQVENYAVQHPQNYGDKLLQFQQNNPVYVQNHSVQPSSVVSSQE